jgi:ABC-2 type transport system permease protein
MLNIWTIARREYKAYFASPIAYLLAFVVFIFIGYYFFTYIDYVVKSNGQTSPPGAQIVTSLIAFIFAFICPAVSMRALSEEQRLGTMELLLTTPIRDWEVIVGKWLGGLLFIVTILVVSIIYPLILNQIVKPGIDQGPLITGYLGLFLISAAFLAFGVAISSFFNNQAATFITTFGIVFILWWLMGIGAQTADPKISPILTYLSMSDHFYNTLIDGIIQLGDVVYFLSLTALALFVGTLSVETRRWR